MNRAALIFAAATAFGLGPWTIHLGSVAGGIVFVAMGVVLAFAASGSMHATAAAAGAVGAFAAGVLMSASVAAAGAILLGLCYAERTLRVRGAAARAAHIALALVAGGIAGMLSMHYQGSDLVIRAVVVLVCAVLCTLPQLVEADDVVAHALDELADDASEPAAAALREGAELRRTVDESMLDRPARKVVRETWSALLDLAHARARLERTDGTAGQIADTANSDGVRRNHREAVRRRLDDRIGEHVAALARAFTAADEAKAAEISLDDNALRTVETTGESLEQVSQALMEEI